MDKFELEKRTKRFALKIIAFAATLPLSKTGAIIEYQLVKAAPPSAQTTVKRTELNHGLILFIRLQLWRKNLLKADIGLNCVKRQSFGNQDQCRWLLQESGELLAIFTSIGRSAKANRARAEKLAVRK
jgi:hypothetical protein